jgi:hypothetical protein
MPRNKLIWIYHEKTIKHHQITHQEEEFVEVDENPCSSGLILGLKSVRQFYGNHLAGNYGSVDKSQAACSSEDSPDKLDHHDVHVNKWLDIMKEHHQQENVTNTSSDMPSGLVLLETWSESPEG